MIDEINEEEGEGDEVAGPDDDNADNINDYMDAKY
jgi:hypothetical protein